jgi:ABC-type Fe3+/spermidine/putrescine transport system ATPase subunit
VTSEAIELEVLGLTRRYSPEVTVGPISFEVHAGEFFSLLGPSGCGKTTTLRCIAGFETLNEGSIRLRGERLDDKPPHRRDVGLVF